MRLFKATDIPVADFNLYFGGCYVRVHEEGKAPRWLCFDGIKGNGMYFDGGNVCIGRSAKVLLEERFPVGFYNTKDSVLYGHRMPIRQVTKGLARSNYSLRPVEKLVKDLGVMKDASSKLSLAFTSMDSKARVTWSSAMFNGVFENPRYFSLSEAYVAMKKKAAFARALSPEFALVPHPHIKDFMILRHELPVAELVSKNKVRILMEEFRQECMDFFPDRGAMVV